MEIDGLEGLHSTAMSNAVPWAIERTKTSAGTEGMHSKLKKYLPRRPFPEALSSLEFEILVINLVNLV